MKPLQVHQPAAANGSVLATDRRAGRGAARLDVALSRPPEAEPAPTVAPVTIADPGPLGLACFALTTFVLSAFNAGLVDSAGEPVVFGLALFYGGIAQVLAGMWEFRSGNTFGATAFTSYGAFWLSFWAYVQFYAGDVAKSAAGDAVGLFLLAWGIFTAYMWIASLRTNRTLTIIFGLLTATFVVLAIGDLAGASTVSRAGGWLGIVTALGAWYASFAGVANATFGRTVLPLGVLKH